MPCEGEVSESGFGEELGCSSCPPIASKSSSVECWTVSAGSVGKEGRGGDEFMSLRWLRSIYVDMEYRVNKRESKMTRGNSQHKESSTGLIRASDGLATRKIMQIRH
jgi:hypothetical protein